jgi:hypothetical protein
MAAYASEPPREDQQVSPLTLADDSPTGRAFVNRKDSPDGG